MADDGEKGGGVEGREGEFRAGADDEPGLEGGAEAREREQLKVERGKFKAERGRVAPPAPGEEGAEGEDEGPGETDERQQGEVGEALGAGGGRGDEGLLDEEEGDDPLEVGDVEKNFTRLGSEEKREGEPGAEGGREAE